MDDQKSLLDNSAGSADATVLVDSTPDAPNPSIYTVINVRMPVELHTELKTQAVSLRLTIKEYALHLLKKALASKT